MPKPNAKTFDVRPILARGEEPLAAIRQRVKELARGEELAVVAPFMPAPLIEMLKSEGFGSTLEHRRDGAWVVSFRRD